MNWSLLKFSEFSPHPLLKIALIAAILLSLGMALKSDYNNHPDEIHHFLAAKYYKTHFLPPVIGDPAVRDTYSNYGVSYLNYHWIEYFLAGKFALAVSPLIADELFAVRLFNVFLLAILTAFFLFRSREEPNLLIFLCFFLISPQIWYIFGYINNDAFALFVSILTAYQIGFEKSSFNKFLEASGFFSKISGGIIFGLLTGILLTLKTNYVTFILFIFLWLIFCKSFLKSAKPFINRQLFAKYIFAAIIALSLLGLRIGMDFYVNGETNFVGLSYINYIGGNFEENQNKLLKYQDEVAEYPYKPSTLENDLMNSDPPMKLKAKGLSYFGIFTEWKWHEMAFRSTFGTYGYMDINAPKVFYLLIGAVCFAFAIFLFYSCFRFAGIETFTQLAILSAAAFLTVFVSTYLSWIYAIQAQGRYFFPILGMFGLFIYKNRRYLHNFIVNAFIFITFLLSVYSFIFIGLARINSR